METSKVLLLVIPFYLLTEIACLSKNKPRVLFIGIDGLLQRCLNDADHSAFDYMKSKGSFTMNARASIEAFSAPGWGSILCGMKTSETGITYNDWWAPWAYQKANPLTPVTGNEKPFPCIFEHIKKGKPNAKTVAYYSWEWFINIGNFTIPGSIDKEYFCFGDTLDNYIFCDDNGIKRTIQVIDEDFDFFFLYLGSLDEAGHEYKFCGEGYINRLSKINEMILRIFGHLREKNMFDDTHIILTTDHGGSYNTTRHADQNSDNLLVPWMVIGPGIKKGYEIKSHVLSSDTTPTISKIFGLTPNPIWSAKPIEEIFDVHNEFLGFLGDI